MTVYKVKPEAAGHQQKTIQRIIRIAFFIATIIFLSVLGYLLIINKLKISFGLGLLLLLILAGYVYTNKQFSRQLESAKSAEIELEEDHILLRKKYEPELRVQRDEVTGLVLGVKSITIQTSDMFRMISITEDFTGFEEIKSKLSSWEPEQTGSKGYPLRYILPVFLPIISVIVGFGLSFITRSEWPWILVVASFFGRTIYLIWYNRKRMDLSTLKKLTKMIGYGVQVIFYGLVLVYLLKEITGKI